jgi:hypothetical protein
VPYQIELSGAQRALVIKIDGLLFLDEQYALSQKAVEALAMRGQWGILVDARRARTNAVTHVDLNMLRHFLQNRAVFHGRRLAIVCHTHSYEVNMIAEILCAAAMTAAVFSGMAEAGRWLADGFLERVPRAKAA